MMVVAKKTIIVKILEMTEADERVLKDEFDSYQRFIRGNKDIRLYAATKQQAERFLSRVRKTKAPVVAGKDYPLILRRDTYKAELRVPPYWFRIPVSGKYGGIRVPIGIPSRVPEGFQARQAKVVRRGDEWYVHLLIQKEVEESQSREFLAIDVGTRNLATVVSTWDSRPRFYGADLRRIRAHFYKLRRTLAKKGAHGAIKKIGRHETRTTNAILHAVTKAIVDETAAQRATIFIGDLRGLLKRVRRSRLARRILLGFPFQKFYRYLLYKAEWAGVRVIALNEAYTSQLCHNCGHGGARNGGRFRCGGCGHEYNADYNGAMNILKRGMGYISMSGAASGTARTR